MVCQLLSQLQKYLKNSKVLQWTRKHSYLVDCCRIIPIAMISLSEIYVLLDSKLKSSKEQNIYFQSRFFPPKNN